LFFFCSTLFLLFLSYKQNNWIPTSEAIFYKTIILLLKEIMFIFRYFEFYNTLIISFYKFIQRFISSIIHLVLQVFWNKFQRVGLKNICYSKLREKILGFFIPSNVIQIMNANVRANLELIKEREYIKS
jgi:hypothetical protein